ncbi:putative cyclin [Lyophyllum shimeji]|uniref:Cyclin n=1 Tax=Lyophyllum shimeji TaxID=47721 RepID=A0A9P3PLQ3_LYOSH|nr:putative cyclin [Lyophyllum shimeji]
MSASHHPDPRRMSTNAPRNRYQAVPPTNATQPPPGSHRSDPFYGHEIIATLSARFITHLFDCPDVPPDHHRRQSRSRRFRISSPTDFIGRSYIHVSRSSGHRLFISAFMIASKVICDDTYSNKSWGIVAQGLFSLREINQMEREMCNYLEWELSVDNSILTTFEKRLREDFRSPTGPYPNYPLAMVSRRAARAAASASATPVPEPNDTTSPIPNFGNQRHQTTPSGSPQPASTWSSPRTPDTPSPSYSNSTSPASSASPATPVGGDDYSARVRGLDTPPVFALSHEMPPVHPLKGQMFAMAMPSTW